MESHFERIVIFYFRERVVIDISFIDSVIFIGYCVVLGSSHIRPKAQFLPVQCPGGEDSWHLDRQAHLRQKDRGWWCLHFRSVSGSQDTVRSLRGPAILEIKLLAEAAEDAKCLFFCPKSTAGTCFSHCCGGCEAQLPQAE